MTDTATPAPAKKSGAVKWIVIVVAVLLVLGGGGGAAAWWFFFRAPPAQAEEGGSEGADSKGESTAKAQPHGDGIVPMEQFLVNLADKNAQRFVRVTLRLVVETKDEAKEIEEDEVAKTRLRSAILELLTQQTADTLTTPEGKEQLKKAIAERSTPVLGGKKVLDVLFTDFVVQF
jgi:flagellar protein FliL